MFDSVSSGSFSTHQAAHAVGEDVGQVARHHNERSTKVINKLSAAVTKPALGLANSVG